MEGENTVKSANKTSVLLLLIGFGLALLGALSFIPLSGMSFFSIASLAAFILELIAIIRLKDQSTEFHKAFVGLIISIILAVALIIIGAIAGSTGSEAGAIVMLVFSTVFTVAGLILGIYVNLNLIKGCIGLVNNDQETTNLGNTVIKFYIITIALSILLAILTACFTNTGNSALNTVCTILAWINFALGLVAAVMVFVFFLKTYKKVE